MKLRTKELSSLTEVLRKIPDPRNPRGIRHRRTTLLAISVAAVLSGARSLEGIAQWARQCTQAELARLMCRRNPRTGKFEPPSEPTIRRFLQTVDAEAVDQRVGEWLLGLGLKEAETLSFDGKTLRGARRKDRTRVHLLSLVLQGSGITIAQKEVDSKSNEIPAARELLEPLPLSGKRITADAMHTQTALAELLVKDKGADYCFTVKNNQRQLKEDIDTLFDGSSFPPSV
jgi:hypothetical protein